MRNERSAQSHTEPRRAFARCFDAMPSTVIRRYAYRPELTALDVEFVSGRIYRYHGVPPTIAEEMRAWRAKGAFLNRKVLGRFEFERRRGWEDPPLEPAGA